ncbi:MAG: outer membrane protein assembly factor BamB [Gammaproteobacteria bacterium]|nr:outer membrane protein assembly factor BamB [Gammaproteobacteria bacterium]
MKNIYLLLLLALAGCSVAPVSEEGAGYRAVDSIWTIQVGHGTEGRHLLHAPVVEGDRLYAVSYRNIIAVERESGKEIWRKNFESAINTGVTVAGDLLLFGGDAEIVAISKLNGELIWRAQANSEILAVPVVANGLVFIRTVDGNLTAHDIGSGEQRWIYQFRVPILSLRGDAPPSVQSDRLFVGTAGGKVIALDPQRGDLLWDSALAVAHGRNEIERLVDIDAPLLTTVHGVVASSYQQGTMLMTPQSGQVIWKRDFSTIGGHAFDGDRLYFGDLEGGIWSISVDRGATYWKQPSLEGLELTRPALQADMIVLGDNRGYVHWFAKGDGSKRFSKRVETQKEKFPIKSATADYNKSFNESRAILASPLIVDDWAYLIDQRGVLEAFRLSR